MLQKIGRLSDYWSQEPVPATPIFGLTMPSRRFLQIMRFLHFVNNEDLSIDTTFKTYKIQYLIDYLCKRFRAVYVPKCELSINETMLKAKGQFQYKQYIKIKPIKWGIKLFTVAESTTGYVLNVLPYTGKLCVTNYGKTTQTVLDVAKDFLMKGHKFFLDNYYMSLELMKVLAQMNTLCCGTVNSSRVGLPKDMKKSCAALKKLKRCESIKRMCGNVLAITWKDTRPVNLLTNIPGCDTDNDCIRYIL